MLNWLKIWWRAVRPFAYPASIIPAILGTALAWSEGYLVNFSFAILVVIGAVMAHTGANLMNDYVDFVKGVDRPGSLGGSGILVEGILKPRAIFIASLISFAIAVFIAIPLALEIGWPLAWLILVGFIAGAGYVLPPFKLKYRALGDITVFCAFGVGITLGSYMVQTGRFSLIPVLYSIPIGMLVAAILHTNNMRDMGDDKLHSFKTFAGVLGPHLSRLFYVFLVGGAYIMILALVVLKIAIPGALLIFVTLPLAIKLILRVWRYSPSTPKTLILADAKTAELNLAFGLMLIIGILLWSYLFAK